jgi:cell division septation protein DedD
VLMALALLGAGIIDTRSIFATQPSSQAPVTTHAPAITQPSTQAPATGETKTP